MSAKGEKTLNEIIEAVEEEIDLKIWNQIV